MGILTVIFYGLGPGFGYGKAGYKLVTTTTTKQPVPCSSASCRDYEYVPESFVAASG